MNLDLSQALKYETQFFDFLNRMIQEHGVYIYLICIWLSPLMMIWILRGGFWRMPKPPSATIPIVTRLTPASSKLPPEPPPRKSASPAGDDSQLFSA
jgi:hypothetical protein